MKTSSNRDDSPLGNGRKSKKASSKVGSLRPLTASTPSKNSYLLMPPRSAGMPSRPKTTIGFYTADERPRSAQSEVSVTSSIVNASRSSILKKTKLPKGDNLSVVSGTRRKSLRPKISVAWDDGSSDKNHSIDNKDKTDGRDKARRIRASIQARLANKTSKTGYKAMSLIPGSLSTMVSLDESLEHDDDENNDVVIKTPLSPCFTDVLSSDGSSEYDTDLEEEFPEKPKVYDPTGKSLYIKMCQDKDLVPVSYFTERLKEKEIIMRHHGLGTIGALPLAKSLKKNTFTEKIDLTDNYIEGQGATSLAEMLHDNCFITEVNLSMNFIRSQGGISFAQMLHKNQSLRKLVLRSNHLTDKDAKAFAEALKENRTLEYLDISHNEIGELGGIYLGAGLAANYGLKHFDVSWNCIRFKGAVGMAQALKTNDCLSHFNMAWNGLSLLGCVALGRFLKKNEALEELDISNNRIGLLGTQKLASGIAGHPNLRVLKIGRNPMGDVGVECLLNVVRTHNNIKFLSLEDITVSPRVFDEIKALEAERGITIITGGIGGYKRPKEMPPGMRILLDFISDNRLRLIDWFNQFDKDHSGGISREEFRKGLKEIGLVMTTRQLDRLIEFIDINDDGEIEYSELLRGREITIQQLRIEKKIEERNKQLEEQRMKLPKLEGYDYDLM